MLFYLRSYRPFLLLFLWFLTGVATATTVEKSPYDPREYRALQLDNQMKVLLISDPSTDKAAASLDVAVGSSANPKDRQGLAHFLEHMLFLGTKKYPEAGEYQNFIQANGGNHNAFTSNDNTNYFFDVRADRLEPALDRFAQFFIAPLFTAEYVDRERHAVDSEYQAKIRDDGRRAYAAGKQAMNPHNSYSRFAVGNLATLADRESAPVRQDLLKFYQQQYSANRMALVILGRESLDQLEQLVRNKFSAVKNRKLPAFDETAPLFLPKQLPALLKIRNLKDNRSLTLTFPVPETRSLWKQKPLNYISDLVGYEGHGSLLSLLKARGWATALAASHGHDLQHEASFMTMIQLTESGLQHYQDVVQLFFDYIELMQQEGIQSELYTEMRQLSQIAFRFREPGEAIHEVSRFAQHLQQFPADQVIAAHYRYDEFDAALIRRFLSRIRADNMLLTLSAPDMATDQTEQYYDTPYTLTKLSADSEKIMTAPGIAPGLSIRKPNPFVAQDLDLLPLTEATAKPEKLVSRPTLELWHQLDADFRIPRANLFFTVKSDAANASARNWVLTSLYTRMLDDRLNESLYDALQAGLSTEIYPHLTGFSVRLSGYNDKLPLLLKEVSSHLQHPEFNASRFAQIKRLLQQQLENRSKDKPYNQTNSKLVEMLLPQWSSEQQLAALQQIELSDLQAFIPQLFQSPLVRILSHGNLSRATAVALADTLQQQLQLTDQSPEVPEVNIVRLPMDQRLTQTLDIDHNDAAVSLYLQGSDTRVTSRAGVMLINEILASPFYSQLRTEQQLGYIVFATPIQLRNSAGLGFVVQSPNTDPVRLEQTIDAFLTNWQQQLPTLPAETLQGYKDSLSSRIMRQENTLNERSQRYWRELDLNATDFDSRAQLQQAVQDTTLTELSRELEQMRRRSLMVRSFGQIGEAGAKPEKTAATIMQQRRQQGLFMN